MVSEEWPSANLKKLLILKSALIWRNLRNLRNLRMKFFSGWVRFVQGKALKTWQK